MNCLCCGNGAVQFCLVFKNLHVNEKKSHIDVDFCCFLSIIYILSNFKEG